MTLTLYNGSRTKEAWNPDSPEFIDDWKPEQLVIENVRDAQWTYGAHFKVYLNNEELLDLPIDTEGYVVHEGIYYGDISFT